MLLWYSIFLCLEEYRFQFWVLQRTWDIGQIGAGNERGFLVQKSLFKTLKVHGARTIRCKKSESCVWKLCSQTGWRPNPLFTQNGMAVSLCGRKSNTFKSPVPRIVLTRETHTSFCAAKGKAGVFACYKRTLWNACAKMTVSTRMFRVKISVSFCIHFIELFCQFFLLPY